MATVVAADWVVTNALVLTLGASAVNFIAPLNIVLLGLFTSFWMSKNLNGAFIHKIFFFYYFLYFLVNTWHLLGRLFFPETLSATYYFSYLTSNGVFILLVATLWLFSVLKFVDNNAEGGLMGVFERNIAQWRKWF